MAQLPKLLTFASATAANANGDGSVDPSSSSATGAAAAAVSQLAGGIASFIPPTLPKQKAVNLLCLLEAVQLLVGVNSGSCLKLGIL